MMTGPSATSMPQSLSTEAPAKMNLNPSAAPARAITSAITLNVISISGGRSNEVAHDGKVARAAVRTMMKTPNDLMYRPNHDDEPP